MVHNRMHAPAASNNMFNSSPPVVSFPCASLLKYCLAHAVPSPPHNQLCCCLGQ
jgi:hypothetical protein